MRQYSLSFSPLPPILFFPIRKLILFLLLLHYKIQTLSTFPHVCNMMRIIQIQIFGIRIIMLANSQIQIDRMQQINFHSTDYIITINADARGLRIELENKGTAEIWDSFYEPKSIEFITSKAHNIKKFNLFVKMITSALDASDQSLALDLLTHQDIEMRKGGPVSKETDPKVAKRRYLILSYMTKFDKVLYPIPLNYNDDPSKERIKISLSRVTEELRYYQQTTSSNDLIKQISLLRQENELLKTKLSKGLSQEKENKDRNGEDLRNEAGKMKEMEEQIRKIKEHLENQEKKHKQELETSELKFNELESKVRKEKKGAKEENKQIEAIYQQKFNKLEKDTSELIANLQHAKELEKKAQIKIDNLEKELEKMMKQNSKSSAGTGSLQRKNNPIHYSPARSHKSVDSKGSKNKSNQKGIVRKAPSIYDSDTESSRMRRATNNRASPFRQNNRPLNSSHSGKKKTENSSKGKSKYSNISNLYSKNTNNNRVNRSRSRSQGKSSKRHESPPTSNIESSMMMTEGNGLGSEEEEEREMDTMEKLRNHRAQKLMEEKRKMGRKEKKALNPIQDKISSIASAIRSFKNQNQ